MDTLHNDDDRYPFVRIAIIICVFIVAVFDGKNSFLVFFFYNIDSSDSELPRMITSR